MNNYPMPSFYNPDDTSNLWVERSSLVAATAAEFQKKYDIRPSVNDSEKIAVFGIDAQVGFMNPGGSLYVPGAVDDANRAVEFIYRNIGRITSLQFSMDTHKVFQIFHPSFWVDKNGNNPDPFTAITTEDIRSGKWAAIQNPKSAYQYCESLEKSGKKVLVVWPYHTLLGGMSHALLPSVMEASIFHSIARKSQTHFEPKGTHMLTENYSVLEPEVKQIGDTVVGDFNAAFFDMLARYDRVYIWGEASSHCVAETVWSIEKRIMNTNPALIKKLYILEDAMSPVPAMGPGELDFPEVARKAIEGFRASGMNVVKTTDPI